MTKATDTTDAPFPIDIDAQEGVHEDAVAFAETFHGVIETIESLREVPEVAAELGFTQEKADAFQLAFKTGECVLDYEDFEAFKREGWDALPDDLREAVGTALAPLAPVFGADMSDIETKDPETEADVILEESVKQLRRCSGRGS